MTPQFWLGLAGLVFTVICVVCGTIWAVFKFGYGEPGKVRSLEEKVGDHEKKLSYLEIKQEKDMKELGSGIEEKIKNLRSDMDSKLLDLKSTVLTSLNQLSMNHLNDTAELKEMLEKIGDRQYETKQDIGEIKAQQRMILQNNKEK